MTKQPKALQLADALDAWDGKLMMPLGWRQSTSDELRRLHAESRMQRQLVIDVNEEYIRVLTQRDALLKALKLARSIIGHPDDEHSILIDAAIKAVEGEKT